MQAERVVEAIKALEGFEAKENGVNAQERALDRTEYNYFLVITTKLMPNVHRAKPFRIDTEVCLFAKDPHKDIKEQVKSLNVGISKVIGVSKLREKFHQYESKRKLCASYDLFLADDRVLGLLAPLLGKVFFKKKRHPAPVNILSKNLKEELRQALSSTYFYLSPGVSNTVRVAKSRHTIQQAAENVLKAVDLIVTKIDGKWENIQSIALKTDRSPALPLYNYLWKANAVDPAQTTATEKNESTKRIGSSKSKKSGAEKPKVDGTERVKHEKSAKIPVQKKSGIHKKK
ncbi:hypothetical protein HDU97_001810 [Phlyctochytrium planicorne]|nr:hypothetical protein HDU97_001810 [Phlyctochytrium planicorne]